jgi:predicted flap endonuclease-1-like 5' DNA nuclease
MPDRKLSTTEQTLAYLIGLGILIIIAAAILAGLDIIENDDVTTSMLIVGLAIVILGIGAWLILVRPWEQFDEQKEPQYTPEKKAAKPVAEAPAKADVKPAPAIKAEAPPEAVAAAKPKAESAAAPKPAPVPAVAPTPAPAPAAEVEAPAKPDDLTMIEGIGAKTAAALKAAGITTFQQVASMTPDELAKTVKSQGARAGKADTWPEQAREAAGAKVSALTDLKGRITSGTMHDDLTQIEGIGPKAQQALRQAGINTFQDLAAATQEMLRTALDGAGLTLLKPGTWPQQANLIVRGDLTALKELQDRLQGGVETD